MVTQHHKMSRFAHLSKVRKKGKVKKKNIIIFFSIHDVFCQNRPIAVPRYDNCTQNML
jgi:hypothetical protein